MRSFSELFYNSNTDEEALEYDSLSTSSEMEGESDEHEEGNNWNTFYDRPFENTANSSLFRTSVSHKYKNFRNTISAHFIP